MEQARQSLMKRRRLPRGPALEQIERPLHVLITRFAIRVEDELKDFISTDSDHSDNWNRDDWLEPRLHLFSEWCAPSVRGQKRHFDRWLILVAEGTSEDVCAAILRVAPGYAEILKIPESKTFVEALDEHLKAFGESFITTRLDADDALAKDFVVRVQRHILPERVVSLTHGYQFATGPRLLVHKWIKSNPFISYWTTKGQHVHQLGIHSRVNNQVKVDEVSTFGPMFLKIAHDSNTAHNHLEGWPVLTRGWANKNFSLARRFPPTPPSSLVSIARAYLGRRFDLLMAGSEKRRNSF